MEEQASKMDKFVKPDEDTYRLYLIALAKEGQAYDLTREANERDLGKRTDISPKPVSYTHLDPTPDTRHPRLPLLTRTPATVHTRPLCPV